MARNKNTTNSKLNYTNLHLANRHKNSGSNEVSKFIFSKGDLLANIYTFLLVFIMIFISFCSKDDSEQLSTMKFY